MQLPEPDAFMDEAERKRFSEYHSAVQTAIAETPVTKDLTSLFKDDFKNVENAEVFQVLADNVCSLTFDVEDVEGKLFATFECGLKGELDVPDEIVLQEYCRCLCDDMLKDGSDFPPLVRKHGTLSIRIWRDRSRFLLTERQMERAPWRKPKPKQKQRGGDAR